MVEEKPFTYSYVPFYHKQVGIRLIPISAFELLNLFESKDKNDYGFSENVIALWRIKWKVYKK